MRDVTVVENETATLTCEPSRTNTNVKWFKDGEEIVCDERIKAITDGKKLKLIIKESKLDDAGLYKCMSDDKETNATLTVEGIL